MKLADLEIFRAVVECGGITRAAERLHRVPSNVTTRIRQLEEKLGTTLFIREGRQLQPSAAGHMLLEYADRILALTAEASDALSGPNPRGSLRLGAMESLAATRLPAVLAEYRQRHPEVRLELHSGPSRHLTMQVLEGTLETALVADPAQDPRLETAPLFREQLLIASPAGHTAIRHPQDIHEPVLLTFAQGCSYRQRLEQWFTEHALLPTEIIEIGSYHTMLSCVAAGMGIALVPRGILDIHPAGKHLGTHPLQGRLGKSHTTLIWRTGLRSARINALLDLLA